MGVIFTFIMGLLMSFESITDNDWFWHVVIGKWVSNNKAIPTKELFSWWRTSQNYDWTAHEWLNELIMYKLGPIGCIALMLLIFLGLYFLMYKLLKINFKKLFDFKLIYLLIMTVFFKVTGPRPYIISLLFFAYFIYILFNYLDDTKPIFKKLIWTLPVVQVLWVNLHGGSSSLPYVFIIGILLCNFIVKFFKFKEPRWNTLLSKDKVKTLLILLGVIILSSCLNPTFYKILLYPFTNMADNNMLDLILEWRSPDFHGYLGLYVFIMLAIPLFSSILSKKDFKLYEIAILGLMFYMCLKSQRFVGMFGIYSTFILGKYFFVTDDMYNILRKPFKKFEKLITVLFIIFLVGVVGVTSYIQVKNFKLIDNDGYYSDEAIQKIIELKPQRMYNDFGQGGYLLYKLDEYGATDDVKLFIFGLGDVFSNNILPDAIALEEVTTDPQKMIAKYNFDVMLTVYNTPLRYYLEQDDNWVEYYSDDMCYIFIRK